MPNEFMDNAVSRLDKTVSHKNNVVSLWFYYKNDAVRGIRVKGVSFEHGKLIGQSMVGKMSMTLELPVWLGYATDGENSHIYPAPISLTSGLDIEMIFPSDGKPNF